MEDHARACFGVHLTGLSRLVDRGLGQGHRLTRPFLRLAHPGTPDGQVCSHLRCRVRLDSLEHSVAGGDLAQRGDEGAGALAQERSLGLHTGTAFGVIGEQSRSLAIRLERLRREPDGVAHIAKIDPYRRPLIRRYVESANGVERSLVVRRSLHVGVGGPRLIARGASEVPCLLMVAAERIVHRKEICDVFGMVLRGPLCCFSGA